MKRFALMLVIPFIMVILAGCWNSVELTQKGFVMGVAIDENKSGDIKLTVQIYKPIQRIGGGGKQGAAFVNIETRGATIFEAARDITLHLGRKAQWSHMKIIIIADKMARKEDLLSVLELFYRDHEPRLSTNVLIAKGEAAAILNTHVLIDQTVSQQLNSMEEIAHRSTGKVPAVNLLRLSQALKSQVPDAVLPLAALSKGNIVTTSGMALVKNGKMIGTLDSKKTEDIQMLTNQFKSGVISMPCGKAGKNVKRLFETVEVQKASSNIKTIVSSGSPKVEVNVKIIGNIGTLKCTKMEKREDEEKFIKKMEETMKKRLQETVLTTQRKKIDLLSIGNNVYRNHTGVWKKWKTNWDERYSKAEFELRVQVQITHSLTTIEKPFYAK